MTAFVQRRMILMADDDVEDCQLVRDALHEAGRPFELQCVRDGEELLDYVYRRGEYGNGRPAPPPDLILLDLKMPRRGGREVIRELKTHPRYRRIPLVTLTTSTASDDVDFCYAEGVNSFIAKPDTFRQWVDMIDIVSRYWFDVVELPPGDAHD